MPGSFNFSATMWRFNMLEWRRHDLRPCRLRLILLAEATKLAGGITFATTTSTAKLDCIWCARGAGPDPAIYTLSQLVNITDGLACLTFGGQ